MSYQEVEPPRKVTPFREIEMRYRRNLAVRKPTDFKDVIDFSDLSKNTPENLQLIEEVILPYDVIASSSLLKHHCDPDAKTHSLKAYKIIGKPGFTILVKAFNDEQEKYWIQKTLTEYPVNTANNLQAHYEIPEEQNLWDLRAIETAQFFRKDVDEEEEEKDVKPTTETPIEQGYHKDGNQSEENKGENGMDPNAPLFPSRSQGECTRNTMMNKCTRNLTNQTQATNGSSSSSSRSTHRPAKAGLSGRELFDKLRWITLGYRFNWFKQEYLAGKTPFPADLYEFGMDIARLMGIDLFKSQAAFVNYYHYGDALTGHTDRSERDFNFPIISASFGHTAVFLVGGQTRETRPVPLFVKSGDIIIMEGEARTAFHGVPRIVEETLPDYLKAPEDPLLFYLKDVRINMNVRQVFS